jgi:GPH family glycoside/pentoside/hexuronide:cation symporter
VGRPDSQTNFAASLRQLFQHQSYRNLTGLYLLGRISIDLTSAMFLYYFTWWLGRPEDFAITMGLFLAVVACSLPGWLAISKRIEKRTIFLLGAASWIGGQLFLFLAQPEWPRLAVFVGAAVAGVGYAAADMIPWSMLGEVVDEGELESGERREGMYFGLFMFLRKLGGAAGVALALALLEWTGYDGTAPAQPASALMTIRLLTAIVPGCFVFLAAMVALRYSLTRQRHAEILVALDQRRRAAA